MKWSQAAWQAAADIYEATLWHPMVRGLADGDLPMEVFLYYLGQDAHYLDGYTRVLAHAASRLADVEHTAAFLDFARDGIAVERSLHQEFLRGAPLPPMSPTCLMYVSVEKSTAYEPVAVEVASLLPCFWIYHEVGRHILQNSAPLDSNPYRRWIETYADPTFAEATRKAIGICDDLAADATPALRHRMTEIFITCARLEWMFWDSAYNLEKWKI